MWISIVNKKDKMQYKNLFREIALTYVTTMLGWGFFVCLFFFGFCFCF